MKTRPQAPHPAHLLAALLALLLPLAAPAVATPAEPAEQEEAGAAAWHLRLDPALADARSSDRYLLVDLYADWCGWCKQMDAQVFSTATFADFAADYVLLRVDVEDDGEGSWLQNRLGARSLPTLAILGPDLARVGLVTGFQPEPVLVSAVGRQVAAYETERAEIDAAVAAGDAEERLAAAQKLHEMQAGDAAAEAFRKAAEGGSWSAGERLRFAAATADSLRLARRYEEADAELARARELLAGADLDDASRDHAAGLLDVASLLLAEELEDCQQLAALEDFVNDRRASPLVGRAQDRLDHLKSEAFGCS